MYQREYAIQFPHDEWPAGRPALQSPVYQRLADKGAHFGARGGWERATWFPRLEDSAIDTPGFQHGVWFDAVGAECRHVQTHAGLLDLGGFSKYELTGPGAAIWLDTLIAGKLPRVSRVSLAYFCCKDGGLWSEMTLTRLAENHFLLITAAAAKWHDFQWLTEHMPADSEMTLTDISNDFGTLILAGPNSRTILQKLTSTDLSNQAFPWLSCAEITIGDAEVRALRVNYVGELGWELHIKIDDQLAIYDALMSVGAGEPNLLKDFGIYAMESMRLEKSYRAWKVELDHEYSPLRSGLSRFVDLTKAGFIGQAALINEATAPMPDVFATFILQDGDTDALYGCPVLVNGKAIGYTTSGGYGHRIGKSIALGYIQPAYTTPGTQVEINVLGSMRKAQVVSESPYDPDNHSLRS